MLLRTLLALALFGFLELWLLVKVAQATSLLWVLLLVGFAFFTGISLLRGMGDRLRSLQSGAPINPNTLPGEAAAVIIAAILLMIPGILSDFAAAIIMIPPVRRAIAARFQGATVLNFTNIHFSTPGGFQSPNTHQDPSTQQNYRAQNPRTEQPYASQPTNTHAAKDWRDNIDRRPSNVVVDAEVVGEE